MIGSNSGDMNHHKVADFYNGKTIFMTGAAGFVGCVLLESLLRCCPGIKSVYILLRPKKNVQPEERKKNILNKKIFDTLKEENEELLDKIHVIAGDTTLPNFGMSDEDVQVLIEEVSIVFHCAAVIHFTKPLEFTLLNNVWSLHILIGLCRKMKKLEVLVYTSTAFSNCNRADFVIKEEIYRLPFRAEKFLEALQNEEFEKLNELHSHCKPDWPNTYTFSKCLAENLIADTASDLPVAIIRPSIVINTLRKPVPGYIEENSGMAALSIGAGKGFVQVLFADPNSKLNLVPVDIVANAHVLAAYAVGTNRCRFPFVVNCSATEKMNVKLTDYSDTLTKLTLKYPLPKAFKDFSHLIIVSNKHLYRISAAYHHYIPALVLDGVLKVLGKKPRIYSMYRFYDSIIDTLQFFLRHCFEFEMTNVAVLEKLVHPEERKDLSLDYRDATFLSLTLKIPEAAPFYDWGIDKRSLPARQRIKHHRHLLIVGIQWTFLIVLGLFIYWLFSLIFR